MTSKLIKRLLIGISLFSLAACSGGSCSIGGHSEADCRMRGPRGAANACCRSSGSPCDGGLTCSTGLCTPCGGAGQPCCASGTCGAPSLACEFNGTTNGVCHACGHDGQTCCNGGIVSSFCVDGTSCTIATGTCGGAGTICSGPSTFHLGLEAANGCTAGDITISSTSLANALACANGMLSGTGRTAVPGSPTGIPNSFPYCEHETYGGFLPKTVVAWSQESADRCANATLTPGYYSASRGSCPLRTRRTSAADSGSTGPLASGYARPRDAAATLFPLRPGPVTAPGLLEAVRTVAAEGGLSLGGFGLAWARLAPTLVLVPAFGMRGMPSVLRLAMAAQLALAVAPMMAGFPADAGVRELVMEAVRGLPMAVLAAAPLWVATMTGGVLDGLRLFPRAEPERSGPFTTLTTLLASVAFLASGGPARVALAAMEVGDVLDPLARAIVAMTSGIGVAVAIAAPIAIASMIVELGLALAARTAGATSLASVLAPLRGVALLSVMGLLLERLASRLVQHAAR